MTKRQFKKRWESDDDGGDICMDDVAECAVAWGISSRPKIQPMGDILYRVLCAVGVTDAEEYKPGDEEGEDDWRGNLTAEKLHL
jgi:hypothetical protein